MSSTTKSNDGISKPTGYELIAAERKRQIEVEGWTPEHDNRHEKGELEDAARCYLMSATTGGYVLQVLSGASSVRWPWDWSWFKPFDTSHRGRLPRVDCLRCLVKAGALAQAELDRLERCHGLQVDKNRLAGLVSFIAAKIEGWLFQNELPKWAIPENLRADQ